jgi:hypothetical protein
MNFFDIAKPFSVIVGAQFIIMCGIYFISKQLLPDMLAGLYSNTGYLFRLTASALLFFTPANVMIAYAFGNFAAHLTAPMNMFAMVILQVAFAVTIFKLPVSPWLILATLATAGSCMWVSLLLQAKPPV